MNITGKTNNVDKWYIHFIIADWEQHFPLFVPNFVQY